MRREYETSNPHKLYKNSDDAILAGVCSGVADYVGVSRKIARFIFFICLLLNFPLSTIIYIILAIMLEKKPRSLFRSEEEEVFWRGVSFSPKDVMHDLRHKFRNMNNRLSKMESHVTSEEYELKNKINKL